MDEKLMIVGVIVLALVIWWFFFRKSATTKTAEPSTPSSSSKENEKPIIYGSLACPYTIKQMEKYPNHTFVDCTSGNCPSFVTAYPVTKWPDGKMDIGFS